MSTTKPHAGRPAWVPPPNIDWTRPASKIAQDCGVCVHTVLRAMRLAKVAVRPRGVPKGTLWEHQKRTDGPSRRTDPSKFDWRHQDVYLGEVHGLTRERVRQVRKEVGAPASNSPEWLAAGGIVTRPQHQGRRPPSRSALARRAKRGQI